MKKTLLFLALALSGLLLASATVKAETLAVRFPDGAAGISEGAYRQLKNAEFIDIEHYDEILWYYQDKVVFRANHRGEMYKVHLGADLHGLTRYLPDGFYKAGKDYYWLADGFKVKLPKGQEYETIVQHVSAKTMAYQGISEENITAMGMYCGGYDGDISEIENTSPYQDCLAAREWGSTLREQLRGKILMRTGLDGSLYFVGNDSNNELQALPTESFRKNMLKDASIHVSKSLMHQIPSIQ
jgi:hypothetical protein